MLWRFNPFNLLNRQKSENSGHFLTGSSNRFAVSTDFLEVCLRFRQYESGRKGWFQRYISPIFFQTMTQFPQIFVKCLQHTSVILPQGYITAAPCLHGCFKEPTSSEVTTQVFSVTLWGLTVLSPLYLQSPHSKVSERKKLLTTSLVTTCYLQFLDNWNQFSLADFDLDWSEVFLNCTGR